MTRHLRSPRQVAVVLQVLILALVFVLSLLDDNRSLALTWFPLLVVATAIQRIFVRPRWRHLGALAVSAALSVVAVLFTDAANSPLLPFLITPAVTGGLVDGLLAALTSTGCIALSLLIAGFVAHDNTSFASASAEWVVLAFASGLAGTWIRALVASPERIGEQSDTSYAAAYRLLAQLRPVARQLSVGLDPGTIAEGVLQTLRNLVEFDRGVVLVRTGGDRLISLAAVGGARNDEAVDIAGEGPLAETWLTQRLQRRGRQLSGAAGSSVVVPLVIGLRTFGLVLLESHTPELASLDEAQVTQVVGEAALRLETALLFDEVRGVATAEERRRVAREIHDGIAQELSYLGYVVDGLAADARDGSTDIPDQLQGLRQEITRIVSELRLSIFDLRSEVDVHGGLGAALSEYVRSVGQQSELTVHMSLAESANRLPAETEAELLRIAQEAITNARKHAQAENLWVTLEVDPPRALLRVEDDGRGLGRARSDSYGLQIMRERARRLRTTVTVRPRQPRGTAVEVDLGSGTDRTRLDQTPTGVDGGLEGMSRR
jgi:signal transduction histidine kinase